MVLGPGSALKGSYTNIYLVLCRYAHVLDDSCIHGKFVISNYKCLPNLILISPIAHVALLQTDMNSGFRFCAKIGKKSDINGATCWKQAFVKSPSNAKEDCLT